MLAGSRLRAKSNAWRTYSAMDMPRDWALR
jgi:hypothetical protein